MRSGMIIALVSIMGLSGCPGIPPVNEATISQTPVSSRLYAQAQRAVDVCAKLPDMEAVKAGFAALGYPVFAPQTPSAEGAFTIGGISRWGPDLYVNVGSGGCLIGVEGMTPQQSYNLVLPWVKRWGAITNAQAGQGLSEHVVQAWRSETANRKVYISAGKTWDPQVADFPNVPGASVRLRYRQR